jgi:hypothetical protein
MNAWAEPFARCLLSGYVDATIVLAVCWLVMRLTRQPARRLALARATLLALLGLPVVVALRDRSRNGPQGDALVSAAPLTAQAILHADGWRACGCSQASAVPHRHDPPSSAGPSWLGAAWSAFAACGTACTAWLLFGYVAARRLLRRAVPAPAHLASLLRRVVPRGGPAPRLALLDGLPQPIAVGVLRPTIVLPRAFVESESPEALRMAMAHEWAHIRGGDLRMLAALRLLLPILFAHPLYWWLRARVREDQEARADDEAGHVEDRFTYAETLLNWGRRTVGCRRRLPAGALGLWRRPSSLRLRVGRLVEGDPVESRCPKCWAWICGALALTGVLVLSTRPALSWDLRPGVSDALDCEVCLPTLAPANLTTLLCPGDVPVADSVGTPLHR